MGMDAIEDCGVTDQGDAYLVVSKEVMEGFQEMFAQLIQQKCETFQAAQIYQCELTCDQDLTEIIMKISQEDYEANREAVMQVLYLFRLTEELYHTVTGTLDQEAVVLIADPETGEEYDNVDNYDWRAELLQQFGADDNPDTYVVTEEKAEELEQQVVILSETVRRINTLYIYEERIQKYQDGVLTAEELEQASAEACSLASSMITQNRVHVYTAEDLAACLYIKIRTAEIMTGDISLLDEGFLQRISAYDWPEVSVTVDCVDDEQLIYEIAGAKIMVNNTFDYEMVPEAKAYTTDYSDPDTLTVSEDVLETKILLDLIYSVKSTAFYEVREIQLSAEKIKRSGYEEAEVFANALFERCEELWGESIASMVYRVLFGADAYEERYGQMANMVIDGYGDTIINQIGW